MYTLGKNRSKRSSGNRKSARKSQQVQTNVHPHPVSGINGRGHSVNSATRSVNAPLLNPGFGSISPFKVSGIDIIKAGNHYHAVNMKEGLIALYECVKKCPGFKDNKDWKKVPLAEEAAHYLFSKLRLLKGAGNEWEFTRDIDGNLTLIFYKTLSTTNHQVCLEWLPFLNKKNPKLHDFVIEILNAVCKAWNLDFIKNHYNEYYIMDDEAHYDDDEKDNRVIEWDIHKYKRSGIANQYYNKLKAPLKNKTIKYFKQKIQGLTFKTHAERCVIRWCSLGIEALKQPANINDYHTQELMDKDTTDGPPVVPADIYSLVWSFTDNVGEHANDGIESAENEAGYGYITVKSQFYVSKKTKIVTAEPIKTLAAFLRRGEWVYSHYYRKRLKLHRDKDIAELTKDIPVDPNAKNKKKLLINILK
jgi:hypothetical protein